MASITDDSLFQILLPVSDDILDDDESEAIPAAIKR
jgi:hypothetical protein